MTFISKQVRSLRTNYLYC